MKRPDCFRTGPMYPTPDLGVIRMIWPPTAFWIFSAHSSHRPPARRISSGEGSTFFQGHKANPSAATKALLRELPREPANALDHFPQSVAPSHRQMLIQPQTAEELLHVERQDCLRLLARVDVLQNGQQ